MLTDADLAQACSDLYSDKTKFNTILDIDEVVVGVQRREDASVICFRGSYDIVDWLRDFEAQMVIDPEIGGVECGFIQGLRSIIGKRPGNAVPDKPLYITGHSLGAARALLFAALETVRGLPLAGVAAFGPPRPGAARVGEILKNVPVRCYRNREDPVCDFPLDIPLVDPYVHVGPLLPLDCAPPDGDAWGVAADHHIELYVQAMKNGA